MFVLLKRIHDVIVAEAAVGGVLRGDAVPASLDGPDDWEIDPLNIGMNQWKSAGYPGIEIGLDTASLNLREEKEAVAVRIVVYGKEDATTTIRICDILERKIMTPKRLTERPNLIVAATSKTQQLAVPRNDDVHQVRCGFAILLTNPQPTS